MDANLTVAGNVLLLPSTNGAAVPFAETGYASTGFLVAMSALVFLMTPGLGLFYSGLSNAKNGNRRERRRPRPCASDGNDQRCR